MKSFKTSQIAPNILDPLNSPPRPEVVSDLLKTVKKEKEAKLNQKDKTGISPGLQPEEEPDDEPIGRRSSKMIAR